MDQELKVVRKAWKVKDPTVWEFDSPDDNWQIVYAETAGEAKSKCSDKEDFLNVKVRRAELADIVLHDGNEISRGDLIRRIADKERKDKRRELVMRFSETDTFYIQNGYVGNSVMWWGLGGAGYTTNILNAQKYTKEEILSQFVDGRQEDRIWLASHVEKNIKQHVDAQNLEHEYES